MPLCIGALQQREGRAAQGRGQEESGGGLSRRFSLLLHVVNSSRDSSKMQVMLKSIFRIGFLLSTLMPQVGTEPLRIGELAQGLNPQQIESISQVSGSRPWLLIGFRPPEGLPTVEAYLPPTITTSALRRGTVSEFSQLRTGLQPTPEESGIRQSYAQVAIDSRDFNVVQNLNDWNRPFQVYVNSVNAGNIEDADLVSLVNFMRSNPAMPDGKSLRPDWPIIRIYKNSAVHFEVFLGLDHGTNERVTLRRQGGQWQIESFRLGPG